MSTSPTEPENAAPAIPVRPEQAHEPAQTADRNNARRAAAQRNPSSSLLSRLFSPSYQIGEPSTVAAGPDDFAETVANTDSSCQAMKEGNDLDDISIEDISTNSMATTMPPAKPLALSAGGTPAPASKEFDISDIRQVNSLLMDHRDLLNSRRGRGTSLERTQKEKRVQDFSNSVFSINPGDTGLINSPAPQSPTAPITSSDNPFLDGVRASYRSWRDAHPGVAAEKAWSFGEQASGEVPEGQVEKSVAEALAGIEPNSRSRKASHSLRFFREGLPEEKQKKREAKDSGRLRDTLLRMKDLAPSDIDNVNDQTDTNSLGRAGDDSTSMDNETPLSTFDGTGQNRESNSLPRNSPPQVRKRLNALPTQLLNDLRKQHNLTPASSKGFSFSHGLPVTESERAKPPGEPEEAPKDNVAKAVTGERKTVTKDDDEESGEEKISSALFVPHKTTHESPKHEVLGHEDQYKSRSSSQQSEPADSEQWLVEHEVPPRVGDDIVVGGPSPHDLLEAVSDRTPEQERDNYFPDALQSSDLAYDAVSEAGYSTKDDESSFTDDTETTPTGRSSGRRYMTENHKDHLHRHQQIAKAPLEAIELIPYRHQVGGHTTMWRFSKRAVCKQLNNRENEFYERIERYHPKLLKFMPRYIGVLNVTFEKQQKRKTTAKENRTTPENDPTSPSLPEHSSDNTARDASDRARPLNGDNRRSNAPRLVSQSISTVQAPTPTVTFADNRHIIPKSLQQPSLQIQEPARRHLIEGSAANPLSTRRLSQSQPPPPNGEFTFRPTLSDKHAASWGATTVNKRLRNEVFGEAFLQQPIPVQRHRRPAHQPRSLAHRQGQPSTLSQLRTSNSESNLIAAQQSQNALTDNNDIDEGSIGNRAMKGAAGRNGPIPLNSGSLTTTDSPLNPAQVGEQPASNGSDIQFEEKAATSASVLEPLAEPSKPKRKRRYSSGSLRRKSGEDTEDRGNLKYCEEADNAGYKGDGEPDVFQMESKIPPGSNGSTLRGLVFDKPESNQASKVSNTSVSPPGSNATGSILPPIRHEPINGVVPIPRPVNPKEAQTQRDKRVEFFLLLEDLTAGMKRPCIMDLKMGTRQYGVDANKKKQSSQRRKCAETTSKELGVRVCGLQVWDVTTKSYIFQDKYFGRKLKVGREFQDALQRFLFDGVNYTSILRHIPTILHKLSELEVLIKDLRGYRFYAASLLMFYDGDVDDEGDNTYTSTTAKHPKASKREIDFKIADFANCVTAENDSLAFKERACPPQHPNEPDKGFLRGLKSLRKYFIDIQKEVVEIERRRGVNVGEGKDIITNGHELIDDPLDEDLGEVSY